METCKAFKTTIYELDVLDSLKTKFNIGEFGGSSLKEAAKTENDRIFIKYPKHLNVGENSEPVFSASPISEYIGSHIYKMLGIEAQDTYLGIKNDYPIVICKNFCGKDEELMKMNTIFNVYDKELNEKLKEIPHFHHPKDAANLNEIMVQLKYNPILKTTPHIEERFWDMFAADIFLRNSKRTLKDWGILNKCPGDKPAAIDKCSYRPAPIYSNSSSLFPNTTDEEIKAIYRYRNEDMRKLIFKLNNKVRQEPIPYSLSGEIIKLTDFTDKFCLKYIIGELDGFIPALERIVPKIKGILGDIDNLLWSIPEEYNGVPFCSEIRKRFYSYALNFMYFRLKELLEYVQTGF